MIKKTQYRECCDFKFKYKYLFTVIRLNAKINCDLQVAKIMIQIFCDVTP